MKYLLPISQNETVILTLRKEGMGQMHAAYLAYIEVTHRIADGV
ncbi:hypothetical protein [Halomonas kalidii]|uniref:Uncharacterized protein n=1 Tax=Halomonas kalidii TaxID=3043293 RepID=A0ABT6VIF8_9GAMM|nr:hypothetical protein [Halomonas kalidii]MDI5933755.1 hypothetical protein [Halomonas kalidii]